MMRVISGITEFGMLVPVLINTNYPVDGKLQVQLYNTFYSSSVAIHTRTKTARRLWRLLSFYLIPLLYASTSIRQTTHEVLIVTITRSKTGDQCRMRLISSELPRGKYDWMWVDNITVA